MDMLIFPLVVLAMFFAGLKVGQLLPKDLPENKNKGYRRFLKNSPKAQIIKRVADNEKAIQDVINEN